MVLHMVPFLSTHGRYDSKATSNPSIAYVLKQIIILLINGQ